MTSNPTIEELWQTLRCLGTGALQRRVDASHPLDLYVDFDPPGRPGLVAVCLHKPPVMRPLRAVTVEDGQRTDGRWSLRLSLDDPRLFPVFAALCHDIVDFTRDGVGEAQLGAAILGRLDHWRTLLERDASGLGELELRGLIGELLILDGMLSTMTASDAIGAWTGPLGTPQDFTLPGGSQIEVKTARRNARTVRINGLGQLDAGADPLELVVVRTEDTGSEASGAVTVPRLIDRVATRLSSDPEALNAFRLLLSFVGWHEHPRHDAVVVRITSTERYPVGPGFPRLIASTVPAGVQDASYTILLPDNAAISTGPFE
jgi:hypothetical protein